MEKCGICTLPVCGCRNDVDYITMDKIKDPISIFDGQKVDGILMSDCYERRKLVKWLEKHQYPVAVVNPELEAFKEAERNRREELGLEIMLKDRTYCEPTTFALCKMPHPDYYISTGSIEFIENEKVKELWKIPFATVRLYQNGKISDAKQLFVLIPKVDKTVKFQLPASDEYASWLSNPSHPNFPKIPTTVEEGFFGHQKFITFEQNGRQYICPTFFADFYREDRLYRFQPLFQCMLRGPGKDSLQIRMETVFQMTIAEAVDTEITWGWCNTFNFSDQLYYSELFTQYPVSENTNLKITDNLFKMFREQLKPMLGMEPIDEIISNPEIIGDSLISASMRSSLPTSFVCLIGLNANMKASMENINLLREELIPVLHRISNLSYNPIFCFIWTRGNDPIHYTYTADDQDVKETIELFRANFYVDEVYLNARSCNLVRVQNTASHLPTEDLELAFFDPTNTLFETDPVTVAEADNCFSLLVHGMAETLEDTE